MSQADYGLEAIVYELNVAGARWRALCDESPRRPGQAALRRRRARADLAHASISPDVNDPGYRNISFDELVDDLHEAARGLTTAAPTSC
jgi:5-methyltetrahydrofolate--homocysteine methyltransferase